MDIQSSADLHDAVVSQHDLTELHQQQGHSMQEASNQSSDGSSGSSQRPRWKQRLIRYSIAAIQAVLLLEVAAIVAQPLIRKPSKASSAAESDDDDFDPADILMDYFSGRRGLSALQLLSNKQLRQAVDNLVTEDYQELGVSDRGAEMRDIVEDIIRVREEGPRPPPKPERIGLGKVGPLRFKSARPSVKTKNSAAVAAAAAAGGDDAAAAAADNDKPF